MQNLHNSPETTHPSLTALGLHDAELPEGARVARVAMVHRNSLDCLSPEGPLGLVTPDMTGFYAVGDFVLHDGTAVIGLVPRRTLLQRKAAGVIAYRQLIAANVDWLAIVTSCNADFNIPRIERYLALAAAAGSQALVVLTKADATDDAARFTADAQSLAPDLPVLTLNAKDEAQAQSLAAYCGPGQTLALVGSSGVGKTTLQNALTGMTEATQGNRAADDKGRHTTTARALRPTLAGGWLIDTPGMRELQLADAAEGIDAVFPDIAELVTQCRFNDCAHDTEPGCAVQAALAAGTLDPARFDRWQKLQDEDSFNTETLAAPPNKRRRRGPPPSQRNLHPSKKKR